MRNLFIILAGALFFAGVLGTTAQAAPWSLASSLNATPVIAPLEVGCRANGRKCPIGSQNVCAGGRCVCKPCPY